MIRPDISQNAALYPHAHSGRRAALIFLCAGLALSIFAIDAFTPLTIGIGVLYIIIVMLAAGICTPRGTLFVGIGCAVLTIVAFLIGHYGEWGEEPAARCGISLAAIALATYLAIRIQDAHLALGQSETRYRSMFELAGVALLEQDFSEVDAYLQTLGSDRATVQDRIRSDPPVLDQAFARIRICAVNHAGLRLFGASDAETLAALHPQVLAENSRDVFRDLLLARIEGKRVFESAGVLKTLDGRYADILMSIVFPSPENPIPTALVNMVDVTERNHSQEELRKAHAELAHATRVTTLGELTASIAHEVNQPLAAIVTNGEASLRWLDRKEPDLKEAKDAIGRTVTAARRAGEVISRLRTLAKSNTTTHSDLTLDDVVTEAFDLLRHELTRNGVALNLDLAAGSAIMSGDRVQLQQVVINLAMNGMQAMRNSRRRELTVETRVSGPCVRLTVRDRGVGFSGDEEAKLFTAFFTTRDDGMGMGLSICRSIVESHSGKIWAERQPQEGAAFHVALPIKESGPSF